MHIPRLAREAGLARGCGERAHRELSSKHQKASIARRTASPPVGVFGGLPCRGTPVGAMSRRPRSSRPLMAAGAQRTSTLRTPSSAPLPPPNYGRGRRLALPTLSGGGTLMAVPVGTAPAPHTIPVGMVRVHPPAATPNVRDPFRVAGEGPGATTHPRSPAPNSQYWELRDSSPGVRLRLWAPFFVF
jgi:hypothetical protein